MKTTSLLAALFALVAYVAAHGNFQCYQYEVTLPDDSVYEFDLYNLLADGNDVYERSTFPSGWLTYNADGYLWAFSAATLSCMDDPNYISVCNGGSVCRFQENATSSPTVLAEDLSYSAIYDGQYIGLQMESETKDSQVIIQYLCDPNNGASYDTKISLKYDDFGTNISVYSYTLCPEFDVSWDTSDWFWRIPELPTYLIVVISVIAGIQFCLLLFCVVGLIRCYMRRRTEEQSERGYVKVASEMTQFQQDELLARKLQAAENLRAVRPF